MKNKTLIIIAAILILFTISVIVFYDSFMHPSKICFPDSSKNKVTVLIAKDGIYDNEEIGLQASKYFDSVKKDLNIENAGLKKFEGKTFEELDKFVDDIYLNDDVGYIILLGDDLPVFSEQTVKIISINDTTGPVGGIATCLVNDSVSGEVVVETSADGNTWTPIGVANPLADPSDQSGYANEAPYTSSGFFKMPVWTTYKFDLGSVAGNSSVQIRFNFKTQDELYNAFRGWILDDITITADKQVENPELPYWAIEEFKNKHHERTK